MSRARLAGAIYVVTFITGTMALIDRGRLGMIAGLVAAASYIGVTWLFYQLFKPVDSRVSLVAAIASLSGIVVGAAQLKSVNSLVFFGAYCLLIGYLILRSTFLPRMLGVLMVSAGLGWLTFASPALARSLFPYNLAPGLIGEGALTLWLLVFGVDTPRWQAQAATARARLSGRLRELCLLTAMAFRQAAHR